MEEDIKVLEEYLKGNKIYDTELDFRIKNLIARNIELEEKENILGGLYYEANENCLKYEKDYIPKSKVREILEYIDNSKPVISERLYDKKTARLGNLLQELLEERN